MSLDVALVSCRDLPEPDPDAAPLAAALEAAGLSSQVMAWDDESLDWSVPRLAVLRSCWNYPQHPVEFEAWATATARATRLLNPLPIVEFSVHKRYLLALEAAGVPVAPTVLVEKGDTTPLLEIMEEQNWTRAVVKPAVSAASFRTLLVRESDEGLEAGESHLRDLAADRDTLVQAYLPSVEGYGERALVWVDGELTHAIRKTPKPKVLSMATPARSISMARMRPSHRRPSPSPRRRRDWRNRSCPPSTISPCPASMPRTCSTPASTWRPVPRTTRWSWNWN
jgi:glutathione synthase/RimK-type ligase-like ATP-grasp enzyme